MPLNFILFHQELNWNLKGIPNSVLNGAQPCEQKTGKHTLKIQNSCLKLIVQSQMLSSKWFYMTKIFFYENILDVIVELSCDPNSSTFWIPC